jgi:hypothetical protein
MHVAAAMQGSMQCLTEGLRWHLLGGVAETPAGLPVQVVERQWVRLEVNLSLADGPDPVGALHPLQCAPSLPAMYELLSGVLGAACMAVCMQASCPPNCASMAAQIPLRPCTAGVPGASLNTSIPGSVSMRLPEVLSQVWLARMHAGRPARWWMRSVRRPPRCARRPTQRMPRWRRRAADPKPPTAWALRWPRAASGCGGVPLPHTPS